ncbi:MAG: hypothetical protein KKH61_20045 [Gammaproteobacteria bacterium]|nr:hypothetical protein [Gammaproteobacteria bacterium]
MASRGFEFAYMLDGSNATPVIRDFTLGAAAAHLVGDLMLMQSDGYIDAVTGTTTEVTCIMQEAIAAADITAGTTTGKAAIITRNQVWRCSMDAASTAAVVAYTKTLDTADKNTIDADDVTNGSMTLVETGTDDDGYVLAYVVFADTSFGNA